MGRSKALLPAGPGAATFVRQLAASLRTGGIDDVLVVGRPDDDLLRREVDAIGTGVRYVPNHDADEGQLSSVLAAIEVIDHPGVQGLLVVPVDQPLVRSATIAAVLAAFARSRPSLARATHLGRHGHPVVFSRAVFEDLRRADRRVGAKAVLRAYQADLLDVEVPDEGAVIDVDDPEAYRRVFGIAIGDLVEKPIRD